ncbi:hypothetical protein AC790_21285 [Pantoea sp. RIT-PI-b]|uniref:T6SS immunity protein Tli3 family protein n=1 Tax=Pantoea sp. RIT-PI-b TaxID=1681195 RepID=UPI0006766432|nr:hypothetical protein [Pantoea sp. RIT-PI-b]KNC05567.1 hypothetical protein AC790_21285 [Pantoea sp. RIT-PI-b]
MRWNQSDRKVLTIIAIIGVLLYALYKGLQFLAGVSMGASFGVGLGGMSGAQEVEESRKVETDAPAQIIYRIDNNRYLTLENYISCDKGGQVYYNDTRRGIKTHLGWDVDLNDFSYRLGNSMAAYQGIIVNGADNGYLAFPGASTDQYCGSGRSERGCPVFFFFSADYGKTFIYKIVAEDYSTPERFSQLKVVVANDGVYLRDESEKVPIYNDGYTDGLFSVNKIRFDSNSSKLINVFDDMDNEVEKRIKNEVSRMKIPYAKDYNSRFDIFDYARKSIPPKSHNEANRMAYELSDIAIKMKRDVYKNRIEFPQLSNESSDGTYQCNNEIRAKTITYTSKSGKREVVNNEQ